MQTNIVFHCDKCKLDDYDDSKWCITKIDELKNIVESNYMVIITYNKCDDCEHLIEDSVKSKVNCVYVFKEFIRVYNASHVAKTNVYFYDTTMRKLYFENNRVTKYEITLEMFFNDVKDGSIIWLYGYCNISNEIKSKLEQNYKLELISNEFVSYYQLVKWPTTKCAIKA